MCSSAIGIGWNLSQQGLSVISQNNLITEKNALLKIALNADLREIGYPVLCRKSNKLQLSEVVLQIQKIRNVAAPKANEESDVAPRMLKLTLTDGETLIHAIETAHIPFISREKTPPGSKVLLNNVKIQNGFLCLNQNNIKLLGGKVPHLCEKWELAKCVQHHSRTNASADGPPAWVNFGFTISNVGDDFKVSDSAETKNQIKENKEFENLRKDAIAEATTGAVRKVFGAGAKLVQPTARIVNNKSRYEEDKQQNKLRKDTKCIDELLPPQKPSDKVSLFDFLENKLLKAEDSAGVKYKRIEENNQKPDTEENNHNSYLFDKNQASKKAYSNDSEIKDCSESHRRHSYVPCQKRNKSISSDSQKQASFDKYVENNKKELENPGHVNSFNTHRGQRSTSNVNLSVKQQNVFAEKLPDAAKIQVDQKIHSDSSYQQRNSRISRRNNEEKMNDNWHYRAPYICGYQVQNKSGGNAAVNLFENMNKLSISGEFASRSLRQHLNLQIKRPNASQNNIESNRIAMACDNLNIGNDCMAKYWEDNKFYPAKITASTHTTYVVQFKGYGNIEEVLKSDCLSLEQNSDEKKKYHRGTFEFRRNRKFAPS